MFLELRQHGLKEYFIKKTFPCKISFIPLILVIRVPIFYCIKKYVPTLYLNKPATKHTFFSLHFSLYICFHTRPGVEIGRQATLRWWCSQGRAGSNPVPGTNAFAQLCGGIFIWTRCELAHKSGQIKMPAMR
jgi:hypothetical protein